MLAAGLRSPQNARRPTATLRDARGSPAFPRDPATPRLPHPTRMSIEALIPHEREMLVAEWGDDAVANELHQALDETVTYQ